MVNGTLKREKEKKTATEIEAKKKKWTVKQEKCNTVKTKGQRGRSTRRMRDIVISLFSFRDKKFISIWK